jgi:hypothetical protein
MAAFGWSACLWAFPAEAALLSGFFQLGTLDMVVFLY